MKRLPFILSLTLIGLLTLGCGGGVGGDDMLGGEELASHGTNLCQQLGLKVINGRSCAGLQNSPVVRIISNYSSGRPGYCSGTMITPTKVLTAGHCGRNPYNSSDRRLSSKVVTGLTGKDKFVDVTDFVVHPGFKFVGDVIVNDLAVATLSHPLSLPTLPVLTSFVPKAGQNVNVYGYGKTVVGTPAYANFSTLLNQPLDLRTGTMTLSKVSDLQYRAENVAGLTSLCHGDSGSPLIYNYKGTPMIIGVTSLVLANDQKVHCAPGTSSTWTRLQAPSVLNELISLVPNLTLN